MSTATADTSSPRLDDPSAYVAPKAECDLIMKGGITSGVVYPWTACRLATRYQLRRLGGASAGAIAATLAAAAELGRHGPVDRTRPAIESSGFVGLYAVPADLGRNLSQLFQPSPQLRAPYRLLTTWIEPGWGVLRKLAASVALVVVRAPWLFALVTVLALLPGLAVTAALLDGPTGAEWARLLRVQLVFLPGAMGLGLLAAFGWLARTTLRHLPGHGFGLCNGHTKARGYSYPPLTDWLTSRLNTLAGRPADGPPLTFADLWGEQATTEYRELRKQEKDRRESADPLPERVTPEDWRRFKPNIDVLVMTTALTFGRPYQFPFSSRIFSFCQSCLAAYFPEPVITQLVRCSQDVSDEPGEPPRVCPDHPTERVRSLPEAPDIPVVLAARLSLSFPLLISAPCRCTPWTGTGLAGNGDVVKVWFSDGGIASNFPMHFFDAVWPGRPTFGINLAGRHPDHPGMVWRAQNGATGIVPRSRTIDSVTQFLGAMVGSMQNWADNTQLTLPGFRDRVVEVRTDDNEGGLNLKMPTEMIKVLAERGEEAAEKLGDFDFDLHRWIRYRASTGALSEVLDDLEEAHGDAAQDGTFGHWLPGYRPGNRYPVDRKKDAQATAGLMGVATAWRTAAYPALNDDRPHPVPRLRQTPPL